MDEFIAKLSKAFSRPLPGWDAQKELINYDRPKPDNIEAVDPDARQSAVLALLYPKNGEIHTVLILRNTYEGTHSGQISFPGGKREDHDHSLWDTATREAQEEVGIDRSIIHKVGKLTPVYIPPSRFLVTPFLAFANREPRFQRDPVEVRRIIESPVSPFLDRGKIAEKKMFIKSMKGSVDIKYFDLEGETLWGATAMIISEISEVLRSIDVSLKV